MRTRKVGRTSTAGGGESGNFNGQYMGCPSSLPHRQTKDDRFDESVTGSDFEEVYLDLIHEQVCLQRVRTSLGREECEGELSFSVRLPYHTIFRVLY